MPGEGPISLWGERGQRGSAHPRPAVVRGEDGSAEAVEFAVMFWLRTFLGSVELSQRDLQLLMAVAAVEEKQRTVTGPRGRCPW